jgi:hypothetical protein
MEEEQQRNERKKMQTRMDQRSRRTGKKESSHKHHNKNRIYENHSKGDNTNFPFCNTKLTVEHILWTCKETAKDRMRMNITKDAWSKGREGMFKLIEYLKRMEKRLKSSLA